MLELAVLTLSRAATHCRAQISRQSVPYASWLESLSTWPLQAREAPYVLEHPFQLGHMVGPA